MFESSATLAHPVMTVESRPFWEAANEGRLLFGKCQPCGRSHYYPRAVCPHCLSSEVEWVPASGRGKVHSFSIARKAEPPYAIAYVTLDEGVSVLTNLVDCEAEDIDIDQPVELVFGKSEQGQSIPLFRPVR